MTTPNPPGGPLDLLGGPINHTQPSGRASRPHPALRERLPIPPVPPRSPPDLSWPSRCTPITSWPYSNDSQPLLAIWVGLLTSYGPPNPSRLSGRASRPLSAL